MIDSNEDLEDVYLRLLCPAWQLDFIDVTFFCSLSSDSLSALSLPATHTPVSYFLSVAITTMQNLQNPFHHCGVRGATLGYAGASFLPCAFRSSYLLPVNRFPTQPVPQATVLSDLP
jgi:hypothetical protein